MAIGDFLFVLSDMTNATINMQHLTGYPTANYLYGL